MGERDKATIAAAKVIIGEHLRRNRNEANHTKVKRVYLEASPPRDDAHEAVKIVENTTAENLEMEAWFYGHEEQRFRDALAALEALEATK